ncbi:MAG: hypothetical protein QOE06_1836 [Thermoleophilaceae bacterium]|nr:hypothetical protein [Thermoleophilaceae bacterium]
MAKLNRAAFSRDDVEDSKRGHPDFDLRDYAAARDLEFMDHTTATGFRGALPGDQELQSNVLRGVLPGGEYGVIAHEGLEVPWTDDGPDWGGTFYNERVTLKGNWKPFSEISGSARIPCTVAGIRVPETSGTHPYLRIDTRRSSPPFSFTNRTKLDGLIGIDGWSVWCEPEPDPATVQRLVAEPVATILRQHSEDGLFQFVIWWGTLVTRRNGYLRTAAELDELAQAAGAMAARLREVCGSLAERQPFDAELPRPLTSEARELPAGFYPDEPWRRWALETAERHGLALENPVAFHRAFPSAPVPGNAHIVLRGEIPHVGPGRLVLSRERDALRPAVLIAAPPGAEPTPAGGVPYRDPGARMEVRDGLLAVWSATSWTGTSLQPEVDAFCRSAGALIRLL